MFATFISSVDDLERSIDRIEANWPDHSEDYSVWQPYVEAAARLATAKARLAAIVERAETAQAASTM